MQVIHKECRESEKSVKSDKAWTDYAVSLEYRSGNNGFSGGLRVHKEWRRRLKVVVAQKIAMVKVELGLRVARRGWRKRRMARGKERSGDQRGKRG
jgi:hypothetical protein